MKNSKIATNSFKSLRAVLEPGKIVSKEVLNVDGVKVTLVGIKMTGEIKFSK
ncbi:hypothetical protein [Fictibacillus sp. 26RED30]|uniref:hypothetical protein n=1 Tax=Fictibacillus sp. 26RED30 TaxID=2745877 RepID=UPI0018CD69A8|nr:hypothetical protein [Fictibacillus sp. 26RED30]MBH0162074.1 hypothetical protein [Fictibacillus sp. 26RED30]